MDIAGKNAIGIVKDRFCLICEDDFDICAFFANKAAVIINVINAGELVFVFTEEFAVTFEGKNVGIGVNACFVEFIEAYEFVAHFIGRIAEHKNNFFCAPCNTAKADGKAVSGKDRENYTDGFAAEFCFNIGCNVINGCIVALSPCNNGFGNGDNVAVAKFEAFAFGGFEDACGDHCAKVIALTEDGAANAAGYGTNFSGICHKKQILSYLTTFLICDCKKVPFPLYIGRKSNIYNRILYINIGFSARCFL